MVRIPQANTILSQARAARSPQFNEAAIRSHCSILHNLARGLDGILVVSSYFANPNGGDAPGTVTHHAIGDVDGMVDAIMAHATTPNLNVYTGLQVMRKGVKRGSRGKETDIIAVLGLVVDLDTDTGRAGSMPIDPNMVLETSPGNYQPFVLFDRAISPVDAKPLAAAMKRATESDHGTADVAHVWRVAGCLNWPNAKKLERGRSPDPVEVAVALDWDGSLTSVEELRSVLEPWTAATAIASTVNMGALPSIEGLPVSVQAAALLAANEVGDRSAWASKVVEKLAYDGLSAEQACVAFLSATGDWFDRYEDRDPQRDFERLWGKFAIPMLKEREERAEAINGMVAKALHRANEAPQPSVRIVAGNDNGRQLQAPPMMHPDPYNPAAAGGLIADIARWITATAVIPVEELSLAASVALIAGVFGSRALTPSNSGVNVFLTTMVRTAGGKGRPPGAIRSLADKAIPGGVVSNGDPTSYAAFERILRKNSSVVTVMDEFGITLQGVNAKKQDQAAASIRKFLLAIYDQGNSVFDGKAYASADTKKDDSPIVGPALTLLSMTTPETLMKGVSQESVTDGFLNRFIFVESPPRIGEIKPPDLSADRSPPAAVVHDLQKAVTSFPAKVEMPGTSAKVKHRVPFDGGFDSPAHKAWEEVFMWQYSAAWNDTEMKLRGRAAENTLRLATLRAISQNPWRPAVTVDDVQWGWAIVHRSIRIIEAGVAGMAGSEQEELRNAIVEVLGKADGGIMYRSRLMRIAGVIKKASMPEFTAAMAWLYASGNVVDVSEKGDGSKLMLSSQEQDD